MGNFNFIGDEKFRGALERDFREMNVCMTVKAWKAVHVLAGSIIEALLIDGLIRIKYKGKKESDLLKMDLGRAIDACKEADVISGKVENLSTVIKQYRNLIHPGRKIRLEEEADEEGATVAKTLVDMIIKEIAKQRKETYGYTSSQIVAKIEKDPSVFSVLQHLIKSLNLVELEHLLMKDIPQKHTEIGQRDLADEYHALVSIENCFRHAFTLASEKLKKEVAKKFVRILKEESEDIVKRYEAAFFCAEDIQWLSNEDKQLVKEHLLARISKDITNVSLRTVGGIGQFLLIQDVETFVDKIISAISYGEKVGKSQKEMKDYFVKEFWNMGEKEREKTLNRLDEWIEHLKKQNLSESAGDIQQVKAGLEMFPF